MKEGQHEVTFATTANHSKSSRLWLGFDQNGTRSDFTELTFSAANGVGMMIKQEVYAYFKYVKEKLE